MTERFSLTENSKNNSAERIDGAGQLNLPTIFAQNTNDLQRTAAYRTDSSTARAYENGQPSVVHIVTMDSMAGPKLANVTRGSGMIASSDGYVLTDYHCIQNLNPSLGMQITTSDGKVHSGTVVDVDKKHDLALVHIDPNYRGEQFTPMKIGSSANMQSSDSLAALGFPDDVLHVSGGKFDHWSTLNKYDLSKDANRGLINGEDTNRRVMETTNPVHAGDSGGPLVKNNAASGILDLGGDIRPFAVSTPIEDAIPLLQRNHVNFVMAGAEQNRGVFPMFSQGGSRFQSSVEQSTLPTARTFGGMMFRWSTNPMEAAPNRVEQPVQMRTTPTPNFRSVPLGGVYRWDPVK